MDFEITDEQMMIKETARKFCEKELVPYAAETDAKEVFPRDTWNKLSELGFAGLTIPDHYGGLGMDYITVAIVMEEIGKGCMATAGTFSVHLTTQYLIQTFGSQDQKRKYLPAMAEGESIGALCLTEPNAGSDISSMISTGVRDNGDYLLNANKLFITTGGEAGIYIFYLKTDKTKSHKGISAFIVEKDIPGVFYGKKEKKMGYGGSPTREIILDNCRLSAENRLGNEGDGFFMVMSGLDRGRITIAAISVGIAQAAFDAAVSYAQQRVQFGQPIAHFQGIQWKMADMSMSIEAARLLTYKASQLASQNKPLTKAASTAKCFATDAAMRVTTESVQIFGGYGYTKDFPVERHMRDAKVLQIVEGTNEIQRTIIARHLI